MVLNLLAALLGAALLVGCTATDAGSGSSSVPPPPPPQGSPPEVASYDLGAATLAQEGQIEQFRQMPVGLTGVIGVPTGEGGPFPVVLLLHGSHPVCADGVDRWPCATEQPNYAGFEYLVKTLASRGFVALAPNLNPEYTLGFGEAEPGVRLKQLVERHLEALAATDPGFSVDLAGRVDTSRLALAGHSRGGEAALALADEKLGGASPAGVLMVASPVFTREPLEGSPVPVGTILPACDADVINQDGQRFYEGIRQSSQDTWAISAWLEGANHNHFNSVLGPDGFSLSDRPDCASTLSPAAQQEWLGQYASDFFNRVFYDDAEAAARIGADVALPAPGALYGSPARVAYLPPKEDRSIVFRPASDSEAQAAKSQGVAVVFCPDGYYTPEMKPERAACQRSTVIIPGDPAVALLSWDGLGDSLAFEVPKSARDATGFTALTMRAAVNPLSPLNPEGAPVTLSIRVTDSSGGSATVPLGDGEPALQYPAGLKKSDEVIPDGYFTGRAPLTAIRVPLAELGGVNLAKVVSVELVFDQSPKGSFYLADVAFER